MKANNTPDELDEILPCTCGGNNFLYGSHYDDCPKALRAKLNALITAKQVEELERVMKMPGNAFVGNGENEIHWQTRNRINELRGQDE